MRARRRSFAALLIGIFIALTWPLAGHAQSSTDQTADIPQALSPEAISELVSKMSPEQTEAFSGMVELLNNSISPSEALTERIPWRETLTQWTAGFRDSLIYSASHVPEMFLSIGKALSSVFEGRGMTGSLLFLLLLAVVLGIAWGAEHLYDRVFDNKRRKIKDTETRSLLETLKLLSMRMLIEIGDVIVYTVVALIVAKLLFRDPLDLFIANALILKSILLYRLVSEILRFILAPVRTDLRLVYTDDWTAQYIFRNLSAVMALVGALFFLQALFHRFQIPHEQVVGFWMSLVCFGWIIHTTWRARKGLTTIIIGNEPRLTPGLERMAVWWPPISIFLLVLMWVLIRFVQSTGYEGGVPFRNLITVLMIIMVPFLDTMVRGIASYLVPAMKGEGAVAEKAQEETRFCYVRIGRVILLCTMIMIIFKLWGLNLQNLAEAGLGAHIATRIVGFLLIVAAGYSAWEITNLVINKKLTSELEASGHSEDGPGGGEGGGVGLSRMATILPILNMTIKATIITLISLLALSQMGVNITPLLAGAGVLGLAIGFGAQTLVKDIVSGVFFLLDDAFRAGEFIDVGGTAGTVEKISVRSMQLRGVRGPIHVLPYGSINQLTNHSRDWVIMKLKFTIPFDTDIDKVRKLFKKIGQEMMEEPELADKFLEPFKGQGAVDVSDIGIVVRAKFTTRPGDQWQIRKEVYKRVQKAFEEEGIEFAHKEVRVHFLDSDVDQELTPEKKSIIAGAAAEAADSGNSGR